MVSGVTGTMQRCLAAAADDDDDISGGDNVGLLSLASGEHVRSCCRHFSCRLPSTTVQQTSYAAVYNTMASASPYHKLLAHNKT